MNKKLIALVVLIAIAAAGAYVVISRDSKPSANQTAAKSTVAPDDPTPVTVAEKKKNPPADLEVCLPENENIKQEDEDPIAAAIAQEVVGELIDVPAGTDVTVPIAFLDDTNAKGSAIYPNDYGTYNFVAKKDSNNSTGWKVTSFVSCKKAS